SDPARNPNLPRVPPGPDLTGRSGHPGDARQSFHADAAVDARRHHEDARPLVQLRHRDARDPRAGDVPSGLSVALAVLQAPVVARLARDRQIATTGHVIDVTAPSAARWPSRPAAKAADRSPNGRRPAALQAQDLETAARYRVAVCRRC